MRTVATLSGGTKQKLNLTLALMHNPRVLLLDEPYQGFDWETYLRFWDLAAELRARGCAVLIISHLLFDQQRFDALYQLHDGRLLAMAIPAGPQRQLSHNQRRRHNDDPRLPHQLCATRSSSRRAIASPSVCCSSSCRCGTGSSVN